MAGLVTGLSNAHPSAADDRTPAQRRAAMTWAQRLKRVFNIDIETCEAGGATVKIIAGIEDPAVIQRIVEHLEQRAARPALSAIP